MAAFWIITALPLSWSRIDGAVFLSARTAAVFCSLVIASGLTDACSGMMAFAISSQVAEVLKPAGFRRVVVAAAPSLDGVVEAILRLTTEDA